MDNLRAVVEFLVIVLAAFALVSSPFLIMAVIEFASWLFIAGPALLILYGAYTLATDTETGIALVNRVKLAIYRRSRAGRRLACYSTPVEEFIGAHCIGPIPDAAWHAHKLARCWGPMPKAGTSHVSPNFSYPN